MKNMCKIEITTILEVFFLLLDILTITDKTFINDINK